MATVTYTVKVDGSPYLMFQDFSDSPLFRDGTRICCFKVPSTAYAFGDIIDIVLHGAVSIQFAGVKKLDGTKLAITEAASTGPPGMTVSVTTSVSAVDLYVFIVFNTEVTNAQILGD